MPSDERTLADNFWDLRDDAFDHPARWQAVTAEAVFQRLAECVEEAEERGEPIDWWRDVSKRLIAWRALEEMGDATVAHDGLEVLYEPVLVTPDGEGMTYQAGAFRREQDAQAVLDLWRAEGRQEEMSINLVPVFDSFDQWQAER